jgi:CDP-paratose 2-epimerase
MKNVLITGSSGLVGSEATLFFLKKKFKVIGIDNNQRANFFGKDGDTNWIKRKNLQYENYRHFNIDITDYKKLEKIFIQYKNKIDLIIHAAAQPSHDWAYQNPRLDFKINAEGTLNMLELFKTYNKKSVFILTSTNKVYGDLPNKLSLTEKKTRWELPKKNIFFKGIPESFSIDNSTHSLFGVSKAYGDLITQEYGKNFSLKTGVFRAGCITGPNHSGAKLHGFLSYLVKSCVMKKEYNLIGYKGKQVRDNIHSHDLVKCFWEYYKNPKKGEVYNMGGGRYSNCSILEAITYIENTRKIKVKKILTKKERTGDHQWYITDLKKFKTHYPKWKLKYNTKKIIDEILINY